LYGEKKCPPFPTNREQQASLPKGASRAPKIKNPKIRAGFRATLPDKTTNHNPVLCVLTSHLARDVPKHKIIATCLISTDLTCPQRQEDSGLPRFSAASVKD
jgi:hypothetical protein